jgi:hypothetical protein
MELERWTLLDEYMVNTRQLLRHGHVDVGNRLKAVTLGSTSSLAENRPHVEDAVTFEISFLYLQILRALPMPMIVLDLALRLDRTY